MLNPLSSLDRARYTGRRRNRSPRGKHMDQDVDKLDHLDKIRRLALLHRGKAPEVERERRPAGRPERSLTATLELLRQAGDAIKRVEERAHETEARSDMLLQ